MNKKISRSLVLEGFAAESARHTILLKQIIEPFIKSIGTHKGKAQDLLLPSKHFAYNAHNWRLSSSLLVK